MDQPVPENGVEERESTVRIEVVVHIAPSTQNPIELGYGTQSQVDGIHNLIRASFETLSPTKVLTFVDGSGRTWHFNINHVTCVEVRTR